MGKKKIVALALLVAAIALIAALAASGDGDSIEAQPWSGGLTLAGQLLFETELHNAGQTGTAVRAADNGVWTLDLDKADGSVIVTNKQTGAVWSSYPPNMDEIASHQQALVRTPLLVRYTQGTSPTTTYPLREQGVIAAEPIDGGARVEYVLESLELAFAVEYRLTEAGVDVIVPFDSIREGAVRKLVSLEMLPYFDAASPSEDGYLFIPDGSGALIRFKEQHLNYLTRYSEFIYGGDYAFKTHVIEQAGMTKREDVYHNPKERAALPVLGMKRGDQGFAAIVEGGAHQARITAAPSGYQNVNLYRTAVEFVYRNDDVVFFGNSNEIPLFQSEAGQGDRSVRYVLLEDDKANYAGMAEAYRDYLIGERGVQPLPAQRLPLQLHVTGGVLQDEILGSTYVAMTRFAQAAAMLDAFAQAGVGELELTLDGWSKDGVLGRQPRHFPAERKLGGNDGLERLIERAHELGAAVYMNANYVMPYADNRSFKPAKEAIRGLDREVAAQRTPNLATLQPRGADQFYLLKPQLATGYLTGELERYAALGVDGLRLAHMGSMLYSDQDAKGQTDRAHAIAAWTESLERARSAVGKAAVDYGFAYTFGSVDRIDGAPLDSSHYIFEDETVPFYAMAVHGLIPYTSGPINLTDNPRDALLRAVEYGALPSYSLTHESSSLLKRSALNTLDSTHYRYWLEPAAANYKRAAETLAAVAGAFMTGHEQIGDGLYTTKYSNGAKIYVNYGSVSAQVGDVTVEAGGFAAKEGK